MISIAICYTTPSIYTLHCMLLRNNHRKTYKQYKIKITIKIKILLATTNIVYSHMICDIIAIHPMDGPTHTPYPPCCKHCLIIHTTSIFLPKTSRISYIHGSTTAIIIETHIKADGGGNIYSAIRCHRPPL